VLVAAGAGVFAVTRASGAPAPPAPTITSGPANNTTDRSATFTYSEAYGSNISMGPQSMEGDLKGTAGDWLAVGYHFKYAGSHPASTVSFDSNKFTFAVTCTDGSTPTQSTLVVTAPGASYSVAANDTTSSFPPGTSKQAATYQVAVQLPAWCGTKANNFRLKTGGTFTSLLSGTDTSDKVQIQWHYVDTGSGKPANSSVNCSSLASNPDPGQGVCDGGWSGTLNTAPGTATTAIAFQCKLDTTAAFSPCGTGATGTITYPGLSLGSHIFQVEAVVASAASVATSYPWTIVKYSPTLSVAGPANGSAGTAIANTAIAATLSASSGASAGGTITFKYFQQVSAPSSCTSGGMTIGTATVNAGNSTYSPNTGFTPTVAGNYWLYATYGGDANNNTAASACPPTANIVVTGKASPTLTVSAPANLNAGASVTTTQLAATLSASSGTNAHSTITFTVFGPQASPPATCTSGGTVVGSATPAGDGIYHSSAGFTPDAAGTYWWYVSSPADANNNAAASTCNSASMTKTVVSGPSQQLTISGDAVDAIYPGGVAQPIAIKFTNPNGVAVDVSNLTVTVASTGVTGCATSDFQITQSNIDSTHRFTVPASSSRTMLATDPVSRPTIRMIDSGNQNACANAHLTLNYGSN
jgi:hypothetical protein